MTLRWRRIIGRYPIALYMLANQRYVLLREMSDRDDEVIAHGRALDHMTPNEVLRWVADELREIAHELETTDELDI